MLGKTHFITGAALGTFMFSQNIIEPTVGNAAAIAIGSLISDIDKRGSKASQKIILPFHLLFKHRGITHSIIGGIGFMLLLRIFIKGSEIAFLTGFLAHIIPDMLTSHGIKLFWPLDKPIKAPLTMTTGSVYEIIFSASMSLWTVVMLARMLNV